MIEMSELKLSVSEIKELMAQMAKSGLTELSLSQEEFALTLKAETKLVAAPATAVVPAAAVVSEQEEPAGNLVKAPIVGTFYAAASPDKPPFVTVGQQVKEGDVLCIIESMKLLNEIKSDFSGTVSEIFVENGAAVEFGQPIMAIE
jgi:acetyl-CoA carboxylase biotin carboxyl carrier protein